MSLQILHPPGWLPPIGDANGISVVAGRIVFIAGQVGMPISISKARSRFRNSNKRSKTYWPFSRRQAEYRATFAD